MNNERGQSLVEMAIITPILLLMLLGLFEVCYVLRNYMIVITTSREAARFATKGDNLIVTDDGATGYEEVVQHSIVSAAGQLQNKLYEPGESGLVISNIVASVTITDCATGNYHVLFPWYGSEYLTYSTSPDYESRLDFLSEAQKTGERHRNIACRYLDENGVPVVPDEHVVIVEMYYTSHQLLGAPVVSNYLTDPIPLYTRAVMRKTVGRE